MGILYYYIILLFARRIRIFIKNIYSCNKTAKFIVFLPFLIPTGNAIMVIM